MGIGAGASSVAASSSSLAADADDDIIEVDFSAYDTPSDTYHISKPEYITFNTDRVRTGDRSIKVNIPEGSHRGGNVRYRFDEHDQASQLELYQRTWIYAEAPDDWTKHEQNWRIFNCALSDGPHNAGVNGAPTGDDGWSNRMYLSGDYDPDDGYANMVSYTYHMDQPRDHGEHDYIKDSPFPLGEWVKFECYVKTNTVSNGSANHDGEVKYWLNGEEIYHRDDFRFTNDRENNIIDYCGPVGYYGGTYEAPSEVNTYYDVHEMRLGAGRPPTNDDGGDDGNDDGGNDNTDYETITVPAGQKYEYHFEEDGEVLENKLIDITADRAEFLIHTQGHDCTIRNIGVRGQWDGTFKAEPFIAYTDDQEGEVLVENFCWIDGALGDSSPNGPTGIFVPASHAGHIDIRNVNIQGMPDHAIHASPPGNPDDHPNPGSGGTVAIEDSYCSDSYASGVRLGTDGSYCENCAMINCDRAYTGFYGETEVIDCDMQGGLDLEQDISVGGVGSQGEYTQGSVTVTATESRFEMDKVHHQNEWADSTQLNGEPAGPVNRTEPDKVEGVPLTPEEAARGVGSGRDPDGDEPNDGNGDEPNDGNGDEPNDGNGDEPGDDPTNGPDDPPAPDTDKIFEDLFGDGGLFGDDGLFGEGGLFGDDGLFGDGGLFG